MTLRSNQEKGPLQEEGDLGQRSQVSGSAWTDLAESEENDG